jgi:hypothetical protein
MKRRSIRVVQAAFGLQFLLSRMSALASTISFRMMAAMATFGKRDGEALRGEA